jgi:hypothetical protein
VIITEIDPRKSSQLSNTSVETHSGVASRSVIPADRDSAARLFFRLIRVRSPTFAYYRVDFSTQVKDGGE